MSRLRLLAALLAMVAVTGSAGASPEDADPDIEIARRYFGEGARAYESGDYPTALARFEAARRLTELPALDYNIGRCLDRMARFDEALAAYERFLARQPNATGAAEVQDRVRVLRARVAEDRARAVQERARAAHPPQRPQPPPSYLGPILVGAGALALAGAGAGLLGSIGSDYDRLASGPMSCRPCASSSYSGLEARAYAGYALLAAAGAAAAGDVAYSLIVRKRRASAGAPDATSPRAFIAPAGAGLIVFGSWR